MNRHGHLNVPTALTESRNVADRWTAAMVWYRHANEHEIEALLEVAPQLIQTEDDWLRLAAIALDQGGARLARVSVR